MTTETPSPPKKKQPVWLIYFALVLAGFLFLADTYHLAHLHKWTVKLGVALVFSAFSLLIGNGRVAGYLAAGVLWVAVIATFFV